MRRLPRDPDLIVACHDGLIRWVYTDDARSLLELGPARIRRVSHVEPAPTGGWAADLSPVGGPTLGPFPTRAAALAAEVEYLTTHVL